MSRFPKMAAPLKTLAAAGAALMLTAAGAQAEKFGLGREATQDEIAAWDIDVRPDGEGLPEGSGDVMTGEEIFTEQCAVCHGDFGEGVGRWPVLAGGQGTLTNARPVKTVGSYWPYLSTVYDYVHRAMPFGAAQSLSGDEVYALTAYILYLNDLVDDEFVLSKENFAEVKMPNEENFFMDDREESPVFAKREVCMTDCKETVEITARARVIDVTPETEGGEDGEEVAMDEGGAAAEEAAPAAAEPAFDAELAAAGESVWKKCKSCHQVGEGAKHRVGPQLNGIIGRTAGTVDGFKKYSKDMVEAGENGLVWTQETLSAYLEKPRDMIKRTRMSFAGLKDEEDRAAVIEYLKAESTE